MPNGRPCSAVCNSRASASSKEGNPRNPARAESSSTLAETLRREGYRLPVQPGTVVPTPTNRLAELGIKFVLQVAIVRGTVGGGYRTAIDRVDDSIEKVVEGAPRAPSELALRVS